MRNKYEADRTDASACARCQAAFQFIGSATKALFEYCSNVEYLVNYVCARARECIA